MSEYAISELERYFDGKPLLYEVKIQDFSRIA